MASVLMHIPLYTTQTLWLFGMATILAMVQAHIITACVLLFKDFCPDDPTPKDLSTK